MGQSGLIVTLEDIVDSLIIARLGQVLIIVIAIALFIYGLKNLRILKLPVDANDYLLKINQVCR